MTPYHIQRSQQVKDLLAQEKSFHADTIARAYNAVYGDYNYALDVRAADPDWAEPLKQMLQIMNRYTPQSIVDVGSNTGQELAGIFPADVLNQADITCVDIAERPLSKTRLFFDNANPILASMDKLPLVSRSQDFYCNLRAVDSEGIDIRKTISESTRVLRLGGVGVFSVAHAFDQTAGDFGFRAEKSLADVLTLSDTMKKEGYKSTGILNGSTEIFVFGMK